jgi:hypothetical protein
MEIYNSVLGCDISCHISLDRRKNYIFVYATQQNITPSPFLFIRVLRKPTRLLKYKENNVRRALRTPSGE